MLESSTIIPIMYIIITCICYTLFRRMGKEYYDELDNVLNEMIPHTECVWEDDETLLNDKDDVRMTNLDWLRTMNAEELARWITNWTTKEQYRYTHSEHALIDWLKEENHYEISYKCTP